MKKRITAFVLLTALCFTGCTKGEDFISEVISKNSPKASVCFDIPQEKDNSDMIKADNHVFNGIYEVLSKTSLVEYIESGEAYFEIDAQMYFKNYIERSNRKSIEVPREECIKLLLGDVSVWNKYNLVIDKDVMYIENSDKEIVENYFFVFISENEEIKNALIDGGFESIYIMYKSIDEKFKQEMEKDKTFMPSFFGQFFNCEIEYTYNNISFIEIDITIPKKTEYLTKFYKNDAWVITGGGANKSCETLTMHYSQNKEYDEELEEFKKDNFRLDLFGSEGKLKEIRLIYDKSMNKIPEFCQATIIESMHEIGCSDKNITEFLKQIPEKSGNIDNFYYIIEKIDKNNCSIKLYVK